VCARTLILFVYVLVIFRTAVLTLHSATRLTLPWFLKQYIARQVIVDAR
jgi:hypothetical protein